MSLSPRLPSDRKEWQAEDLKHANPVTREVDMRELRKILKRDQGQFLEFVSMFKGSLEKGRRRKSMRTVAQEVAESLSAFANSDGGTLLAGVEEGGGVLGLDCSEEQLQQIADTPRNLVKPALSPKVERIDYEGEILLKFKVAPSPVPHQLADGRYLLRVGRENLPFSADQVGALKQARAQTLYERQFLPGTSVQDLDGKLLKEFKGRLGFSGDPLEMLSDRYGLVELSGDKPKVTLSALLLFARDPLAFHPRCGVEFLKYEGKERRYGKDLNLVARLRIEAPLFKLIDEASQVIRKHVKERTVPHDLFYVEKFEYPTLAWQEALTNAVAHRDYGITGCPIEVSMFDDRVEVRSPGMLPEPLSLDQLYRHERVHFSRNPLLVRVLADLGYVRELGEGIPRIFNEMENNYLQPPELTEEGFSFCVVLKNTPLYDEDTQKWVQAFSGYPLNWRQRRALAYAKHHGMGFTSKAYQKVGGVDRDTAYREIREMVKLGIASPYPEKHARRYRVLHRPKSGD